MSDAARGPQPPARRPLALIAALSLLAMAFGLSALWFGQRLRREPLPVLGSLPAFSLTAHDGVTLTLDSLRGHVWVADFIFTRCGGVCPAMTARMKRLRNDAPPALRLVSFSVDPLHDTTEVLARYAEPLAAGSQWSFVTGDQAALYALATDGFMMAAMEVPPDQQEPGGDGPFLHSSRFVLLDAEGQLRGYYDSTDEEAMARLLGDITSLL